LVSVAAVAAFILVLAVRELRDELNASAHRESYKEGDAQMSKRYARLYEDPEDEGGGEAVEATEEDFFRKLAKAQVRDSHRERLTSTKWERRERERKRPESLFSPLISPGARSPPASSLKHSVDGGAAGHLSSHKGALPSAVDTPRPRHGLPRGGGGGSRRQQPGPVTSEQAELARKAYAACQASRSAYTACLSRTGHC
jgi:hypothetical protein